MTDWRAELATLRRMREALVKLRDELAAGDTEEVAAADQITEVLAMSAAPIEQSKAPASPYDDGMVRGLARAAAFLEQDERHVAASTGELWDDACREALAMARKVGLAAPRSEAQPVEQATPQPACVCGQATCRCWLCERCGATVHGFHRGGDCRPVEQLRAGDHGYKLGAHRARILDALLTDIDRTREQHGSEERIERLAHAVAVLAGAPL